MPYYDKVKVSVHGSAEATEDLKQQCLKHVTSHVYAPQIEETVDVMSDLSAYKVSLESKLYPQFFIAMDIIMLEKWTCAYFLVGI